MIVERNSMKVALNMLKDTPILYLNGIRQCGKSTLAMQLASQLKFEYLTFDSPAVLSAAQNDPQGFIENIKTNVVLDEVQMVPEIFRNLKIFILENMFVIQRVFPWFRNIGKRFVKATKNYFTDTLMLCNILGIDLSLIKQKDPLLFGHIFENFVFSELMKNLDDRMSLFHFRTSDNKEVDFVIEKNNGDLIGIEVKSKVTISTKDFAGLNELKKLAGSSLKCGIVLYPGNTVIPFAKDMFAVPIQMI